MWPVDFRDSVTFLRVTPAADGVGTGVENLQVWEGASALEKGVLMGRVRAGRGDPCGCVCVCVCLCWAETSRQSLCVSIFCHHVCLDGFLCLAFARVCVRCLSWSLRDPSVFTSLCVSAFFSVRSVSI